MYPLGCPRPGRKAHLRPFHMDLVHAFNFGCNERHGYARKIRKHLRDLYGEARSAKLDLFFHGLSPVDEEHNVPVDQ
jgi:hypothetical protein